jgi:hypothetical protein
VEIPRSKFPEVTLVPGRPDAEQQKFFCWVRDNVDFQPRLRRVD